MGLFDLALAGEEEFAEDVKEAPASADEPGMRIGEMLETEDIARLAGVRGDEHVGHELFDALVFHHEQV